MSINGLLNIGRSSLQVNQTALQVTGHNIANVNTPGYTRQRVGIETTTPFVTGAGVIGTGVRAQEVTRVYDRFLAFQIKGERENFGALSSKKDTIARVEEIFNELSGSGLKDKLTAFFNSLKDLSNNAGSYAERAQVLSNADLLAYTIKSKATDLSTLRTSIDNDVKSTVSDVNSLASQIADLNGKIADQELSGASANDLRDRRDGLMADLSGLINYNYVEDNSGQVTIFVGKGTPLVDGIRYNALSTVVNAANSNLADVYISSGSGSTKITSDISSGKLKGLLNVRDSVITGYQTRLNTLTANLAGEINAQHALGYGLDGSTGLPLFSVTAGSEAATISLAVTDTNKIAAAAANPLTNSGPADNGNALLLAGIQDKSIAALGNTNIDTYYNAMVTDIGARSQSASKGFEYQKFTRDQLETRIESVSGVSMDEEASNLIKFQRAYQASAKLITTADELLLTILDLKR